MRNWKKYNESLVKRGEVLLDFDVIDNWHIELEKMNQGKKGRKFVYPQIHLSNYLDILEHTFIYHTDKQTEGVVRE
ncbi:MAG: IS5/IS1182 family transposase, partial [Deltaproteobacteria bacterium]